MSCVLRFFLIGRKAGTGLVLNKIRFGILAFAVATMLTACASPGPVGQDSAIAVADLADLPAPTAEDYSAGPRNDLIRPLDVLDVAVFGVAELTRTVRVGSGGFFDYPLIGAVQANGRSLAEISYEIETRLSGSYVRDPDVTIELGERAGQIFTVGGQVTGPGQYKIVQPTSLMEAIAIGGGGTQYSRLDDVLVFREVSGQRYIGVYDMRAIQRGNYPDPQIYAHDVIIVGDSPNRRLIADVLTYSQLVTSPLILLERAVR